MWKKVLSAKVFPCLLALSLAIGLTAVPAAATEGGEENTTPPVEETVTPSTEPTEEPSEEPPEAPSEAPSEEPSEAPSEAPSKAPSEEPSDAPSEELSEAPSEDPSEEPSEESTKAPSEEPTEVPSKEPSEEPSEESTEVPSEESSEEPAAEPTATPADQEGEPATGDVAPGEPAPEGDFSVSLQSADGFTPYSSVTGDGDSINIEICGSGWSPSHTIEIHYADGTTMPYYLNVKFDDNGGATAVLLKSWHGEVTDPGTSTNVVRLPAEYSGETPKYIVTATLPVDSLDGRDFSLTLEGQTYTAEQLGIETVESSGESTTKPSEEPTTEPFVGQFYNWSGVPMVDGPYPGTLDKVGVAWDGDYIYILMESDGTPADWDPSIRQGNWNSICASGPNSNGQFAITTDLGRTLMIQPVANGNTTSVAGLDGAKAVVNNTEWTGAPHYWELKIPASALPEYKESINFGYYLSDPLIKGVMNLNPTESPTEEPGGEDFNGIVIDGEYDDWKQYPHTTIQYATEGTQEHVVDAEGALCSDGGTVYGHVTTSMPAHLEEQGGEFLAAVTFAFNWMPDSSDAQPAGDTKKFQPKFMDEDGNIYNAGTPLEVGKTYTFYMYELGDNPGWYLAEDGSWQQTASLAETIQLALGTIKVTVGEDRDDAEFELDLEKVAKRLGVEPSELQTISAQFGRLGQQWISCAGTPTGPWLGLGLCLAAVGGVHALNARKKKKEQAE